MIYTIQVLQRQLVNLLQITGVLFVHLSVFCLWKALLYCCQIKYDFDKVGNVELSQIYRDVC